MILPKRLYPHLFEFYRLKNEGRDLGCQHYARKHERKLEYESVEMFNVMRNRKFAFGTNEKVHKIEER